jgi:hypothetical protein
MVYKVLKKIGSMIRKFWFNCKLFLCGYHCPFCNQKLKESYTNYPSEWNITTLIDYSCKQDGFYVGSSNLSWTIISFNVMDYCVVIWEHSPHEAEVYGPLESGISELWQKISIPKNGIDLSVSDFQELSKKVQQLILLS